ncbi:putative lipoprotein [Burkholderia cepacia]|uniref:Lipoprotein n=1 Tax=Burkholderia cepacia TaxID=292 RepID=A0AA88YUA9_BURCE|nr:putative lipoprotein [Burkholderia cepacia]
MNERHYASAVARLAALHAACFPSGRSTGRAARPVRTSVLRFKESRHV